MYLQLSDTRLPLKTGDVVDTGANGRIIVDQYIGSGGFSLMYLAHMEGSSRCLALKELFPRQAENVLIRRREDGKICIFDPVSGCDAPEDSPLWQELTRYFVREAELTRRAGTVYDREGRETLQNHPDVLHVDGPFRDSLGNFYLAIDTFQGEPLRELVERGFVRNETGEVVSNQFLAELLDLLTETAVRLSELHARGLWHLDLSPDNIYVVPSAGQTRLVPYLIDFGSAYDRADPAEAVSHRYTCNPFSAPEVLALAQLQSLSCGYAPDASSDTYVLASILFYAVTGQIFSSEHRMGSVDWAGQLRREFAAGLPSHQGAESFAGMLVEFLERGLSAAQNRRFSTATEVHSALMGLSRQYREYGDMLPLVERDELMSYMVLEKYPLYRYRGSDGNLHVLCLGSGVFVKRMILSLISCGQMIGSRLYIHVVSSEPEALLKTHLLRAAPALEDYSNLCEAPKAEYVTFRYEQVRDVLDPGTCRQILERHGDARYFVISLGSNSANIRAAGLYARALAERPNSGQHPMILNYYCSEDAANTVSEAVDWTKLPKWLKAEAFGVNLSSYSVCVRTLGLRTLKLAHMYNKLGNPNISLADSARSLTARRYDQRSSCAAALHLKYKLASIGIDPDPGTDRGSIIDAWQNYLSGGNAGAMLELEHRRWMMYMIADGYRLPNRRELERYGFEMVESRFNGSWKCKERKLHPCLVPCGTGGIVLKPRDFVRYRDAEAIQNAPFDELDRVSLTLHALSKRKCRRILESGDIEGHFHRIALRLNRAREDGLVPEVRCEAARTLLEKTRETICTAAQTLQYRTDHGLLSELEAAFGGLDLNISGEITGLGRCLAVFAEYAGMKDYKDPDDAIIRNLLWILYAEKDITCIKLRGRTIADNITGPLILDPNRLIFFGQEPRWEWDEFLHRHGNRGEITYLPRHGQTIPEICAELSRVAEGQRGRCVIDITGADEQLVIAAQRAADGNSRVSLVRSTADGMLENIHGFVTAPAYTLNTAIAANEIFTLYGARELPAAGQDMEQLEDMAPVLWRFYQEFRRDWPMLTAFFSDRGAGSPELLVENIRIDPDTRWLPYTRAVDKAKWRLLELDGVFKQLTGAGILREFETEEELRGRLTVSFRYPCPEPMCRDDVFHKALDEFFHEKIMPVYVPLRCELRTDALHGDSVEITSGCRVDVPWGEESAGAVPALKRLRELRLITDLELADGRIRFLYGNPAVKDCLRDAGNILALYIRREARQTHYFDNTQANFSFVWEEGVSNELDVILTRGLTSLIISAKTTRLGREHLYEIKYLAERFSLNSKPVIVCASEVLPAIRSRARAMGIWLIDLNELGEENLSLGDRLAAIADGTAAL